MTTAIEELEVLAEATRDAVESKYTELGTKRSDEWQTPPEWLERFAQALGGRIGLDPCYGQVTNHRFEPFAEVTWGPQRDALSLGPEQWQGHGPIYMNPPFSSPKPWAYALSACKDVPWLALVNTQSSSAAWHELALAADIIAFPRKRISFIDPVTETPSGGNRYDQTIFTTGRRADVYRALSDVCLLVSKPGWSR